MLPWIILARSPSCSRRAFAVSQRKTAAGEHPPGDTPAEQARIEQEFEDAEAYQEKWREEEHEKHPPESLY